jgi:putative colanic acid biosynthesis UDP-glucose lipid carrier transferase
MLLTFGLFTQSIKAFNNQIIIIWLLISPICQLVLVFLLKACAPYINKLQGQRKLAVVAGVNNQGIAIAESLINSDYNHSDLLGFFDDRSADRLKNEISKDFSLPLLGKNSDIPNYVKNNSVDTIYISLPMVNQKRIVKLLDDLKDTTVSIYLSPDIFLTDLIQGGIGQIDGIPVVSICESPITGIDAAVKRTFDILFSLILLLIIFPILILIGLCIKITSTGPIIFKQRRYGLDGKEIVIYKFRTMTTVTTEIIEQAKRNDKRVTTLGYFLRKTSLDELPQFVNVIQGRMSVVGPRPHAISHNEIYRKIIKGYMVRHKVKPGITGWAQVNGFRGETESIEKMQARIEFDIDYLRNWSPKLDIHIIAKTVLMLLTKRESTY